MLARMLRLIDVIFNHNFYSVATKFVSYASINKLIDNVDINDFSTLLNSTIHNPMPIALFKFCLNIFVIMMATQN